MYQNLFQEVKLQNALQFPLYLSSISIRKSRTLYIINYGIKLFIIFI